MRIRWQQVTRGLLALFAVGFAVAVFLAIRDRQPTSPDAARTPRTDPNAVAESTRGTSLVARGAQQDFKVEYERALTYADGTLRFDQVKVLVPQRQGRDFTITGRQATVTNNQADVAMDGDVRLTTSDGLSASANSATYQNADGMLRIPGPVRFEKERMTGSGVGATYDRMRDVLWLLEDAKVTVAAAPGSGSGATEIVARSAGFARRDRYMRFEGAVRLLRDGSIVEADSAIAYLAADDDRLEMLELRGNSRVRTAPSQPGGLESMTARDMNLTYGPDGRTLRQAALAGRAAAHIAGPPGQRGRRLGAEWMEFALAEDGSTITSLVAREGVELDIPGENPAAPGRRIRSVSLEGRGEPGRGLTAVRFVDDVSFREQRAASRAGPAIDRVAESRTLDAAMQPGLGAIERATFGGGVTFRDGTMDAQAPDATYDLGAGSLRLVASPGGPPARVNDPRVTVDARTIDLTLGTNSMKAVGDVRSQLKAEREGGSAPAGDRKRPGMLSDDQPVNVTAQQLDYDGAASKAIYTGDARLWQGETAVHGASILLDDQRGNLTAKGSVRTVWRLEDTDPKSGAKEKKTTVATAEDLVYDDEQRRATYTTNARMIGPEGDLRAATIELYFDDSGQALDRLEARTTVVLQSENRTCSGASLTYFAGDARYVMSGAPVRVLEQLPTECRETTGLTLTFFRSTDSILVDGNQERRTQTTSGGKCPGSPPGD